MPQPFYFRPGPLETYRLTRKMSANRRKTGGQRRTVKVKSRDDGIKLFFLLDGVGKWRCRHERHQWNIKIANDAGGLKGKMGFASKLANKALFDQSRSKARVRRFLNGRAARLHPRKAKPFFGGINSRRYRHTAILVRQRAVLNGMVQSSLRIIASGRTAAGLTSISGISTWKRAPLSNGSIAI